MSNTCKSQHLKLYLRLKQEEYALEKSLEILAVNSGVDPELWRSIKRDNDRCEIERQKLVDSLKEKVTGIYEELKIAKAMVNVDSIKKIDVGTFKTKLQSVWKRVEDYKSSSVNPSTLVSEQNSLEAELASLLRSIRKHRDFSAANNLYCKGSNFKSQSLKYELEKECNYDDIEDFCTLLAKTGHTGNWLEEDHLLFMKLRKKHSSIPALVSALKSKCPDLSTEAIVNHEAWYKTYLDLREKQRLAVQEWRHRKEEERRRNTESLIEATAAAAARPASRRSNPEEDRLLRVAEHKRAEIEKKKEALRKWREHRDKIKAAEEERLKNHARARRELRESRRRARDARLKKLVAEYKEKKEGERREEQAEDAKPSAMSAMILKFFREKDQQYLEKRRNIMLAKINEFKNHLQPVQPDLSHIGDSTLLKETKAWQEKHKTIEPKRTQSVNYIKDLPKRALVTWKSYEIPNSYACRQI